jgi:transposase-like protein
MPQPHETSPERRRQVIALYDTEGKSMADVAVALKMGRDTVRGIIRQAGVSRGRLASINEHPSAVQRCADLIKSGVSIAKSVAKTNAELGLTFSESTYLAGMMREGLRDRPQRKGAPVESDGTPIPVKTEVTFDDMVILKKTVMVPVSGLATSGMTHAAVSLSAGLRFEAAAA